MVRRSMVLLMVLLAVALLTPQSALAAKNGTSSSNYRVKVFVVDTANPGNSVSATFTCMPMSGSPSTGTLSGSFFLQVGANGKSVYGEISPTTPFSTDCTITQSGVVWGTPSTHDVKGDVKVESVLGNMTMGTIDLQLQNAVNGHNFAPTPPSMADPSCSPSNPPGALCVSLALTFTTPIMDVPTVFPVPTSNSTPGPEVSASLSLSVRG